MNDDRPIQCPQCAGTGMVNLAREGRPKIVRICQLCEGAGWVNAKAGKNGKK